MPTEWDRLPAPAPGSLDSMGRELRARHGSVMAGLDDKMISLLVRLLEVPWPPHATSAD
jgi:hypothetical protein